MGASTKRRELRRNKFAVSQSTVNVPDKYSDKELTGNDYVQNTITVTEPPLKTSDTADDETVESPRVNALRRDRDTAATHRFICFIATTQTIEKHFSPVKPSSVRHRTEKSTCRSKGFAFLEFDSYSQMQKCIRNYHHSNFSDGQSAARKINVELTVGGGGAKSRNRQLKLRTKNDKLGKERKNRIKNKAKAASQLEAQLGSLAPATGEQAIHPSRRSRVEH
ncbi:MAG: hypothetical protein LQ340_004544 [Diploschistes diacapsis]|nr:MAG: hypothetical protein LQ340_004544 [Diploschistes diacapsis]